MYYKSTMPCYMARANWGRQVSHGITLLENFFHSLILTVHTWAPLIMGHRSNGKIRS